MRGGDVQQGMQDGQLSEATGSKALNDIGKGDVSGVERIWPPAS